MAVLRRLLLPALALGIVLFLWGSGVQVLGSYWIFVVTLGLIYSIAAVGAIVLVGDANMLSLAGAAFFAIGAYGTELCAAKLGVPWLAGLMLA